MKFSGILICLYLVLILFFSTCAKRSEDSQQYMVSLLKKQKALENNPRNTYAPDAELRSVDSLLAQGPSGFDSMMMNYFKSVCLMQMGRNDEAARLQTELATALREANPEAYKVVMANMALANLRLGEQNNCIAGHAAESCIIPIKGMGVHSKKIPSLRAKEIYASILRTDPGDLTSRWLFNIACMSVGDYPAGVPKQWLIPGLEADPDPSASVKPFEDIAEGLKINVNNMAGGVIVDDFDNDGYLDIMTSSYGLDDALHFFRNNVDGTFTDISDKIGVKGITGGLNMMQADYNNDGFKDVLVLRGAWKMEFGKEPNSLLRNNGDGTFTDVTSLSGLLSFHPTQTATWNDFNNDGWIDLFIGNETVEQEKQGGQHPCELFINNGDGTFTEVAKLAHCDVRGFVKGVTSGDYDNDGWKDIFISNINGGRTLLRNTGKTATEFEDVTHAAGIDREVCNTFPTWFWDYNNDGWLDIFVSDFTFEKPLPFYAASEALGITGGDSRRALLYRNNHDGTFTNVANEMGLDRVAFAMGSNFGDIDNDGFLDVYLGTGNPNLESLIPNKMFRNLAGEHFADVTVSARVGHLQKGHGVSFADLDNDGDQDIYIDMGGGYPGDAYPSSFFLNPGQNNNHWICIDLVGKKANRAAIGTTLKISFTENNKTRTVYRDVNSGGSFGASPLRRELGLGVADKIDLLEIRWHGSGEVQTFRDIRSDQFIRITEGDDHIEKVQLKALTWTTPDKLCVSVPISAAAKE